MIVKFRLRRDTAANWTAENPVLAIGEPGYETDTRLLKHGDGVTAWNALPYYNAVPTSEKGAANGVATLDAGGKVPAAQLPSYVDDVLEYANLGAFPGTGETSKIYVADDTGKIYRWSGSAYIEISPSPGSTDAVTEGATNLYFTNARARGAVSSAAAPALTYNGATGAFDLSANLKDWSGKAPPAGGTIPDATDPTDIAYAAGNFAGSAGTWTVQAGDVETLVYAIVGKVMTIWFNLQTTTVTGAGRYLYVALPAGKTSRNKVYGVYHYYEGSAWKRGFASVDTGGNTLRLEREDNSNWLTTADGTYTFGQLSFPIN